MSNEQSNGAPNQNLYPGALSEEEYRKQLEWAEANCSRQGTEEDRRFWDDFAWTENNPEFKERYVGKWVAVYKRELLAVGDEGIAVLEEAARKSGAPPNTIVLLVIPDTTDWHYWDPHAFGSTLPD
jgi:hypothetical protein